MVTFTRYDSVTVYLYIYIIDLKVRENDINFLMSNKSVLNTKLQYRSMYITHDV